MHLVNQMSNYLYKNFWVSIHNFLENLTRGTSNVQCKTI